MSDTVHLRHKVCRVCLEERPKLAHLGDLYFDDLQFVDIIKDCFNVAINLHEKALPLLICKSCLVSTLNFYAFKNSIIENEVFLQNVDMETLNGRLKRGASIDDMFEIQRTDSDEHININKLRIRRVSESETESPSSSSTSGIDGGEPEREIVESSENENANQALDLSVKSGKTPTRMPENEENVQTPEVVLDENKSTRTSQEDVITSSNSATTLDYACSICSSFFTVTQNVPHEICTICAAKMQEKRQQNPKVQGQLPKKQQARVYSCNACERIFAKASEWKTHMIAHYGGRSFNCLHCNKCFESKHELVVHTYTHLHKVSGNGFRQANARTARNSNCLSNASKEFKQNIFEASL